MRGEDEGKGEREDSYKGDNERVGVGGEKSYLVKFDTC